MDTLQEMMEEQPTLVIAGGATVFVVLLSLIYFMRSSTPSERTLTAKELNDLAGPPVPVNQAKSKPKATGKKGKKKKSGGGGGGGGVKSKAVEPAPTPAPAPEPTRKKEIVAPEKKIVEDDADADAGGAAGKKKKKKKNKKKGGGATGGGAKTNGQRIKTSNEDVSGDDDDTDSEDELDRLLNKKQLAKVRGLPQPVATTAVNGSGSKSNKKPDTDTQPALVNTVSTSKDDWVSVSKSSGVAAGQTSPTAAGASPDEPRSIMIDLSPEDPPLLIGPKGATIQAITESSGARLDINKSTTFPSVKITGTEGAVANAMEQIQAIISTAAEERRRATAHTVTLSGDKIKGSEGVKAIIGKGGANIQSIQTETGASLNANVEKGEVVITGPTKEQVEKAATLCRHAVFGESQHTIELGTRGMVLVVYGKEFAKIRSMQTESGAKLDVERGSTTLKLSGSSEAVRKARTMIEEWMEHCKGQTVQIEANKVGAVYGKAGQTIRRIQDRTGAFIEVDDKGKKGKDLVDCRIMGEPDAVKEAMTLFQKAVDGEIELKPGEVLETLDLGVGVPAVIGRGGSKIRELEQAHTVKLNVNADSGMCQIVGKKADVDNAKKVIEKIVKPLLEEHRLQQEAAILAKETEDVWQADLNTFGNGTNDADGW